MATHQQAGPPARQAKTWVSLAASIALPLLLGAVGGLATDSGWYVELHRPSFAPPGWVFGPVWTVLYGSMGTAAWWVWRAAGWPRARHALGWYAAQLLLNALWSPIFFGLRAMGWALIDIGLMGVAIVGTLVAFYRIERRAGLLLVPYLLWVAFAAVLNWSLWTLN